MRFRFAWLLLIAGLLAPAAAHAHAVLLGSDPPDRVSLVRPPPTLVLRFNETVTLVSLQLIAASDGRRVATPSPAQSIDREVRLDLPADLPQGGYVASWRVVSEDSHPIAGSLLFAIGDTVPEAEATTAGSASGRWEVPQIALRALLYGGLLIGAGGSLFLLLVGTPSSASGRPAKRIAMVAAGLTVVAGALSIGVEGAALAAASPSEFFDGAIWRLGGNTSLGHSMVIAVGGALLMLAAARHRDPMHACVGALIAIASLALTGHVATAAPRWLTVPVVLSHGLAASFWVGALPGLALVLWREPTDAALATVHRFSRLALGAVLLLIASGLAMGAVQLEQPGALFDTNYGQTLLAKLALVVLLLGLALFNRLRLTPRVRTAALWRSICVELALAAGILLVTSLLGETAPPRALAEQAAHVHGHQDAVPGPGYSTITSAGSRMALIALSPARAGTNRLDVTVTDAEGAVIDVREANAELSQPDRGIEPLALPLQRSRTGEFGVEGATLPLAGPWHLRITALITDFEQVTFEADLPVGP